MVNGECNWDRGIGYSVCVKLVEIIVNCLFTLVGEIGLL